MEQEIPPPLPPELRARIPRLYATERADDPIVQAKLFTPWADWTWFVTEFDGEDKCFGLVSGHEVELGYFSLSEIAALEGPADLPWGLGAGRELAWRHRPRSSGPTCSWRYRLGEPRPSLPSLLVGRAHAARPRRGRPEVLHLRLAPALDRGLPVERRSYASWSTWT